MRYRVAFTVPAATPATSPVSEVVKLARGVIRYVELYFPPGVGGAVSVVIVREEHQVWPASPTAAFTGDDLHITIRDAYKLDSEPYAVELRGWSPGATYDHTIYVDFELEPLVAVETTATRTVFVGGEWQ